MHFTVPSSSFKLIQDLLKSGRALLLPDEIYPGPAARTKAMKHTAPPRLDSAYDAWLSSRMRDGEEMLSPGVHRSFSIRNVKLAYTIVRTCALDLFLDILELHRMRTIVMMSLNIIRSIVPAFRGYSQALIIDELQSLVTSGNFTWARLLYLVGSELTRRLFESLLDSFAAANETKVIDSARFFVERAQLEQRLRLDIPTLADPQVRALLQESDLFARSFSGSGFGLLSPLDFIHIISLTTEIFSHVLLILSLTGGAPAQLGVLLLSVVSATLPLLLARLRCSEVHSETMYTTQETRAAERQERMRNWAYNEAHRPEIELFGLGGWILDTWTKARQLVLDSEQNHHLRDLSPLSRLNFSDLLFALQNVPLVLLLQTSSASLGSLTLYRSSIQAVIYASKNLLATSTMAFQGIFFMSAFCAGRNIKPQLQPDEEDSVCYNTSLNGASIQARNLSYTYPGASEPALDNISFTLNAGETLAIVGYNGSGKSTLAKILLRIIDFDSGELYVNDVDIRRYEPSDYHQHITGVFQGTNGGFSKFNTTVRENVGLGRVERLRSKSLVEKSIRLAQADDLVNSLPYGLRTDLDTPGFESMSYPGQGFSRLHGLSGGEWQRLSIARAFMRASEPQVDLMLFDEPTSSLDAHAQNQIFDAIHRISHSGRGKSVIFITHRLYIAKRADKVAMMQDGTIIEFGSHDELIKRDGAYAALYRASV
ncbi:unnamed protein product [Mycena citricolor]|uniref:ABC transporter domain-containing protein n=1 Tax=Mycena citricolor TaxID=2018698 RepID=A0AAD2HH48_9AGAR|nr:unnamed protein product [Mycena citricolor]